MYLQAILFYLPRSIWLMLEGGLMKFLAKGARKGLERERNYTLNNIKIKISRFLTMWFYSIYEKDICIGNNICTPLYSKYDTCYYIHYSCLIVINLCCTFFALNKNRFLQLNSTLFIKKFKFKKIILNFFTHK